MADLTADTMLLAILADPADDAPRLALSDWLEENGQGDHAELIRVQVALAIMRCHQPGASPGDYCNDTYCEHCHGPGEILRRREGELLHQHWSDWMPHFSGNPPVACGNRDAWPASTLMPGSQHVVMTFRRGFIAKITLTTAAFMEHAPALFRICPIEEVKLSDKEPTPYGAALPDEEPAYWRWFDGSRVGLPDSDDHDELPGCLWAIYQTIDPAVAWEHPTKADAHAALSRACVLYGNRAAWKCPRCGGDGMVNVHLTDAAHTTTMHMTCPLCHGQGWYVGAPLPAAYNGG